MRAADDPPAESCRFGERFVVMQRIHAACERRESAHGIHVEGDYFRDSFVNAATRIHGGAVNNWIRKRYARFKRNSHEY
ncbi:hypothetical protein [Burkholderia pseudomallei]|uniref:hypothetical protein n=1 Tax=Burkholderia pseudomallei TaxID=28450 RepID=UPI002D1FB800|nr:hypothetical protein [Burkholderia pseudomallei]